MNVYNNKPIESFCSWSPGKWGRRGFQMERIVHGAMDVGGIATSGGKFAGSASKPFGSLLYLPERLLGLQRTLIRLFSRKKYDVASVGYDLAELGGRGFQVGGEFASAVKVADECSWIDLTAKQTSTVTSILGVGLIAAIGLYIKEVYNGIAQLAKSRLNDTSLSPTMHKFEVKKFTSNLLKLILNISLLAIQIFALIALLLAFTLPIVGVCLATAAFLSRMGLEFHGKEGSPSLPQKDYLRL